MTRFWPLEGMKSLFEAGPGFWHGLLHGRAYSDNITPFAAEYSLYSMLMQESYLSGMPNRTP
jgi:hypothetical protein